MSCGRAMVFLEGIALSNEGIGGFLTLVCLITEGWILFFFHNIVIPSNMGLLYPAILYTIYCYNKMGCITHIVFFHLDMTDSPRMEERIKQNGRVWPVLSGHPPRKFIRG